MIHARALICQSADGDHRPYLTKNPGAQAPGLSFHLPPSTYLRQRLLLANTAANPRINKLALLGSGTA
jgi:hypothetical protein